MYFIIRDQSIKEKVNIPGMQNSPKQEILHHVSYPICPRNGSPLPISGCSQQR